MRNMSDWLADRSSGLQVDVDGRRPAVAVEGDHVSAATVDGGTEVAGRARHHRPGDAALAHSEAVRIGVDGRAPAAAVEREGVPFAVNGNAEAGRSARHCLQVAARVDGGWLAPGAAVEGEHVRAVVDGGAEVGARARHRAQLVARIYGRGGTPGGPVERERVGAVVHGGTEARCRARYRRHASPAAEGWIVNARTRIPRAAVKAERRPNLARRRPGRSGWSGRTQNRAAGRGGREPGGLAPPRSVISSCVARSEHGHTEARGRAGHGGRVLGGVAVAEVRRCSPGRPGAGRSGGGLAGRRGVGSWPAWCRRSGASGGCACEQDGHAGNRQPWSACLHGETLCCGAGRGCLGVLT